MIARFLNEGSNDLLLIRAFKKAPKYRMVKIIAKISGSSIVTIHFASNDMNGIEHSGLSELKFQENGAEMNEIVAGTFEGHFTPEFPSTFNTYSKCSVSELRGKFSDIL